MFGIKKKANVMLGTKNRSDAWYLKSNLVFVERGEARMSGFKDLGEAGNLEYRRVRRIKKRWDI